MPAAFASPGTGRRDDLGLRETYGRDGCRLELPRLAGDDFGDHLRLRRCLVREHRLADQIADGPDILDGRLALIVNLDEGPFHINRHLLQAPAFRFRPAANGDEDLVGRDLRFDRPSTGLADCRDWYRQ